MKQLSLLLVLVLASVTVHRYEASTDLAYRYAPPIVQPCNGCGPKQPTSQDE